MSSCCSFQGSWSCDGAHFDSDFSDEFGTLSSCVKSQFQQVFEDCCQDVFCDCCCGSECFKCYWECVYDWYFGLRWSDQGDNGCIVAGGSCLYPGGYIFCDDLGATAETDCFPCQGVATAFATTSFAKEAPVPEVKESAFFVKQPGKIGVNRKEVARRVRERANKLRGFTYPS
jgi:hypothetical protein